MLRRGPLSACNTSPTGRGRARQARRYRHSPVRGAPGVRSGQVSAVSRTPAVSADGARTARWDGVPAATSRGAALACPVGFDEQARGGGRRRGARTVRLYTDVQYAARS
eukprot:5286007-Prymnesium_polylepis.1